MHPIDDFDDAAGRLAWLHARSHGDGSAGLHAGGWPDSIWLLHAMFERPDVPPITHQQWRRAFDPDQPGATPTLKELRTLFTGDLAGVSDDELQAVVDAARQAGRPDGGVLVATAEGLVDTGIPLGYTHTPTEPHWRRLFWWEWSARCGRTLGDQAYPPGYSWFNESFPVSIQPPPEGSLDELTWERLLGVLSRQSSASTAATAYYAPAAPSGLRGDWAMFAGRLSDTRNLLAGRGLACTPSNLWPDDRSWFVYTDADLMATKVSGSAALIAALMDDNHIETLRWEPSK